MQHTDLPPSWAQALESVQLHKSPSQPPTGQSVPWYAPIMRFGKKGFLLTFLSGKSASANEAQEEQAVALRLELLLPQKGSPEQTAKSLITRLSSFDGVTQLALLQDPPQPNQPILLDALVSGLSEAAARELLLFLLKLGDHVVALDSNPEAPSPLEEGKPAHTHIKAEQKEAPAPSNMAGSPFESIGASAPPREQDAPPASSPTTRQSALRTFHLRAPSPHHLELELDLGGAQAHRLIQSISRNISTRFDAQVESGRHNPNPVLELRPAISHPTPSDIDRLYKDTHRYMERLIDLAEGGIPLDAILGTSASPPRRDVTSSFASSRDEMRRTRRDIPSSQHSASRGQAPPTQPATEQNTGFVLAIDPTPSPSSNEPAPAGRHDAHLRTTLRQGDFTDERLRREDATTSLVDVVLRHPGYSDKNMAKVLTLLLSVDYSEALSIIALAPCVLARGTGQERARTMKSVVEGAGGKVVLVEPDTFATT